MCTTCEIISTLIVCVIAVVVVIRAISQREYNINKLNFYSPIIKIKFRLSIESFCINNSWRSGLCFTHTHTHACIGGGSLANTHTHTKCEKTCLNLNCAGKSFYAHFMDIKLSVGAPVAHARTHIPLAYIHTWRYKWQSGVAQF